MQQCQPHGGFRRRDDPSEFNLREWDSKANRIARQNTNSRRFSASNIASFREDIITRRSSFRSNISISSTASSPGYPLIKDEIDPLTYSFTTALKALQAKSGFCNNLDCLSPEGFALHSKWNDAEKYISNPQSGQVPMECLSARSFRNLHNRITMSAPLVYSTNSRPVETKIPSLTFWEIDLLQIPIEEKKVVGMTTRDIGIQIGTPADSSSSSSPSPFSTPSIQDRVPKYYGAGGGESSNSSSKPKSEVEVELLKQEREDEEKLSQREKKESEKETSNSDSDSGNDQQQRHQIRRCGPAAGCLSWMIVRRHETEKHRIAKPSMKTKKKSFSISFSSVKSS